MADGLVGSKKLIGMTRQELQELLGSSPENDRYPGALTYWLGPERGFMSIDSEWLVIGFDDSGKASSAEISND